MFDDLKWTQDMEELILINGTMTLNMVMDMDNFFSLTYLPIIIEGLTFHKLWIFIPIIIEEFNVS